MDTSGEPIEAQERITLVERQAFMKLPMDERRKIMAKQAREMAAHYKDGKVENLETSLIFGAKRVKWKYAFNKRLLK